MSRSVRVFKYITDKYPEWGMLSDLGVILETLVAEPALLPLLPKDDKIAQDFGAIISLSRDASVSDDHIACEFYKALYRLTSSRSGK